MLSVEGALLLVADALPKIVPNALINKRVQKLYGLFTSPALSRCFTDSKSEKHMKF